MRLDGHGRLLSTSQLDISNQKEGVGLEVRRKPWLASVVCEKRLRGPISAYKAVDELKHRGTRRYHPSRRTREETGGAQTA